MKPKRELTKLQAVTTWVCVVALTGSLVADVIAFIDHLREERNWQKAVAEDIEAAKAEDKVDG